MSGKHVDKCVATSLTEYPHKCGVLIIYDDECLDYKAGQLEYYSYTHVDVNIFHL
jgi:hypothetical protein